MTSDLQLTLQALTPEIAKGEAKSILEERQAAMVFLPICRQPWPIPHYYLKPI